MGAALPIDVRQALDRLPMVTGPGTADVVTMAIAKAGLALCQGQYGRNVDTMRQSAAKIAAACIRLVEYLNQEWP